MPQEPDPMRETPLKIGQLITGPLFNEPMRVETIRPNGSDVWMAGIVGVQSERFRNVTLADLDTLIIQEASYTYHGDSRLLRLGVQAYSLGIAYEFDPYFGLSISRVDPFPHPGVVAIQRVPGAGVIAVGARVGIDQVVDRIVEA